MDTPSSNCSSLSLSSQPSKYQYTTVPGYFQQSDFDIKPETFDWISSNLGLVTQAYPTDTDPDSANATQWQRFEHYVRSLNTSAPEDTQYKVFFLGRHGEGFHNVAEAFYGRPKWNESWSKLTGDDKLTWADSRLTELGVEQALKVHQFWAKALKVDGIPAPESYYVSPLDRCCHTAHLTFSNLTLPGDRPFKPIIKELTREWLGEHTCDRRSTKTEITARWPDFAFEAGFTETDELFMPYEQESKAHFVMRLREFFDDVFDNDENTFISVTAHSGSISAALVALGHRRFPLPTGGIIAVFVKAEKIPSEQSVEALQDVTEVENCS